MKTGKEMETGKEPTIRIEHGTTNAPAGNTLVKHPETVPATSWRRITVAFLRSGQRGKYADSETVAEIAFEDCPCFSRQLV